MMAVVEQCPRESRAPHPDYYRTRKKTRFHLNELFTSRPRMCWVFEPRENSNRVTPRTANCDRAQSNKYKIAKTSME